MNLSFGQARYANAFRIGHNAHEMFFDFGQVDPDGGGETIHTRIVIAPAHARLFLDLFIETTAAYEKSFGPLPISDTSE